MKDTRTLAQRLAWIWRKRLVFESYRPDTLALARQTLAEHQIFYTEQWLERSYVNHYRTMDAVDATCYQLYVDREDWSQASSLLAMGDF